MKSYTDLKQSRIIAEILPHNTADQIYERFTIAGANLDVPEEMLYKHNGDVPFQICGGIGIPCWSLAALLDYLCSIDMFPSIENDNNQFELTLSYVEENKERPINAIKTIIIENKELIDACVELIIKLNEKKLL